MNAYHNHLQSSDDLVTTYEATRAGFVALALASARALQEAANLAKSPNVDICLFDLAPEALPTNKSHNIKRVQLEPYTIALGELKGGIDPAGADEHWKTAQAALNRIRQSFADAGHLLPLTFFVGAAIERRMATEIWKQLESQTLSNAANLNEENQVASISRWLCSL
ncbi:type II restriction endonuclease [Anabaenopsis sp. FSS-46]|uniref:AvaI/BsoBI family type II restriction endonuclease n=1 Tax=Anabaenopsis sp. FSS-46 TaxID=2971766 RepID=UPI002476FA2A|nr:AvaI/BsoBI family type II restriction endonuclease [Anabaenopsis sp. FSS-46]MDH6100422.1 type II restriction endonuclease [Anabaenopsis sp. FSS-46]